jgi:hypothetical protein
MNFLKRNVYQHTSDTTDNFSDTPNPSFLSKWFGGVIVPVFILIYGLRCCILQKAVFEGGRSGSLELSGMPAVFMGLSWLSAAFFIHFHYFWSAVKRLCVYADFAKTIALLCLIGTFGYVVWSIIM